MYLVDTNIFLEVLLSQVRKDECEKFLSSLKTGKRKGIITDFSLHSLIVILGNLNKVNELKIFLSSLTAYKGLNLYHSSITDHLNAVEIALQQKLDMDDAIQVSAALSIKAEAIVSFDKHFNNLRTPKLEPHQIK